MSRALKIAGVTAGALVAVVAIGTGAIYALSGAQLKKTYPVAPVTVTISDAPESIDRGRHLVEAVGSCMDCHGEDFGGKVVMDAGPIGVAVASNLTRGAGGIATRYTDADWVRAIRNGLRPDGTSLILMPSEAYAHLTDDDVASMIAYLKQVQPVDRELPRSKIRILGRTLLVAGKMPLLAAEHTPQLTQRDAVEPGPTAEYGRYLANVSGCTGCHGADLGGGPPNGPPGTPAPPDLTRAALGAWTEADFARLMREGTRPDGRVISEFMPWRFMAKMSDDELRAIWAYLQSVPPRSTAERS